MALLELELNGLTVQLERGQSLGVPGGWGAGKSSLLRWIAGLEERTGGRVQVDGLDLARCPVRDRLSRVALVLSEPTALFSGAAPTVRHEVAWSLENLAIPRPEMVERVDEALQRLGLVALADRSPYALSGGEQQRVALACALVLRPALLLLDEPASRLDGPGVAELIGWVRTLGPAVVWATPRCQEVAWCERWWVLEEGYLGPPRERAGTALAAPGVREPARRGPSADGGPWLELREADGVTLRLARGEKLALLGANGAGKSTLAQVMAGLRLPATGSVWLDGEDTRTLPPGRLAPRVGYLFQEPRQQIFCATVFDEVAFAPRQAGWSEERVQTAVQAALSRAEVRADPRANPLDLPPGELLWVALASVLAQQAPLLILDEPTAHLDGPGWERFGRFLEGWEGALVLITHDFELAAESCSRLVVLDRSQVCAEGTAEQVLGAPGIRPVQGGLPEHGEHGRLKSKQDG